MHNHQLVEMMTTHKVTCIALLLLSLALPNTIFGAQPNDQQNIQEKLKKLNREINLKELEAKQITAYLQNDIHSTSLNKNFTSKIAQPIVRSEIQRFKLLIDLAALVAKRVPLENKMPKQDKKMPHQANPIDVSTAIQDYYKELHPTENAKDIYQSLHKFLKYIPLNMRPTTDDNIYTTIVKNLSNYTDKSKRDEGLKALKSLKNWEEQFMVVLYWYEKFSKTSSPKKINPPLPSNNNKPVSTGASNSQQAPKKPASNISPSDNKKSAPQPPKKPNTDGKHVSDRGTTSNTIEPTSTKPIVSDVSHINKESSNVNPSKSSWSSDTLLIPAIGISLLLCLLWHFRNQLSGIFLCR